MDDSFTYMSGFRNGIMYFNVHGAKSRNYRAVPGASEHLKISPWIAWIRCRPVRWWRRWGLPVREPDQAVFFFQEMTTPRQLVSSCAERSWWRSSAIFHVKSKNPRKKLARKKKLKRTAGTWKYPRLEKEKTSDPNHHFWGVRTTVSLATWWTYRRFPGWEMNWWVNQGMTWHTSKGSES